jgi:hypothetical protein
MATGSMAGTVPHSCPVAAALVV